MSLSAPNLTDLLNEGAITKTLTDILGELFHGATGNLEGILLNALSGQLDEAEGAQGAKSASRAICKNVDAALEAKGATVEQKLAVGQALADNVAAAALRYAALVRLYPALQGAVVAAKQGTDKAALQAARSARDVAAGNLKTALGDLVRASAGAAVEAVPAPTPAQILSATPSSIRAGFIPDPPQAPGTKVA